MNRNDELYHHGIKGQVHGVRNGPPYPLSRQKKKSFKNGGNGKKLVKSLAKKADIAKERHKAKAEERAERRRKKQLERDRKHPASMWNRRDMYTDEELDKALKRFDLEKRLHDVQVSELKRGKDYLDLLVQYSTTGIKLWNNYAAINNAIPNKDGTPKKQRPIINVGNGDKNKERKS